MNKNHNYLFFFNIHTYKNYKKMLMFRNIKNRYNSWIMVNHVRYGLSVCLSLFFFFFFFFPFFSSIKKRQWSFDVLMDAFTILPDTFFFFFSCESRWKYLLSRHQSWQHAFSEFIIFSKQIASSLLRLAQEFLLLRKIHQPFEMNDILQLLCSNDESLRATSIKNKLEDIY